MGLRRGQKQKCHFKDSVDVGKRGEALAKDFIEQVILPDSFGSYTDIDSQYEKGDLWYEKNGVRINVEVKTDTTTHPNFFIEHESSEFTDGWVRNLKECHKLWYIFINKNKLYEFDWKNFTVWYEGVDKRLFMEKGQKAVNQKNKTKGYIIPIKFLLPLGFIREINLKKKEKCKTTVLSMMKKNF